jgi:ABC-2 type transport system permease protein
MKELKFLLAIWKTNLQSAMEYRAAFLTQVIGMMVNNFIYFAIWIIFFDRFKDVRGWGVNDMYVTFGVLASSFGLVSLLFGNAFTLSEIINNGRLDYYLSLPRPVLLHTVSSRMISSGMGDFTYGFVSYALSGQYTWDGFLRFILATFLAAVVFASFLILVGSLAFWFGIISNLTNLMVNAMITFAIYPSASRIGLLPPAGRSGVTRGALRSGPEHFTPAGRAGLGILDRRILGSTQRGQG